MVSYDTRLFLGKPRALMFVHEIPLPGFISKHSEVLKQLQGIHLRNNWFSSLWGHVRIIIVVYVIGPFRLQSQIVDIGLRGSLGSYMFRDKEPWCSKIDFGESFSSSGLEDPVIWMQSWYVIENTIIWPCVRIGRFFWDACRDGGVYPLESMLINVGTKPCCLNISRWNLIYSMLNHLASGAQIFPSKVLFKKLKWFTRCESKYIWDVNMGWNRTISWGRRCFWPAMSRSSIFSR